MSRVREAIHEDLPKLLAIQSASLDSGWPKLLTVGIDGPPLVLVTGNEPVGYALAVTGEPTYLVELAVAPVHRSAGHGSALLNAVLARGGKCRLTACADDERARRFYEHHGFRVAKRLPEYYGTDDGLLFIRQSDAPADSSSGRS